MLRTLLVMEPGGCNIYIIPDKLGVVQDTGGEVGNNFLGSVSQLSAERFLGIDTLSPKQHNTDSYATLPDLKLTMLLVHSTHSNF